MACDYVPKSSHMSSLSGTPSPVPPAGALAKSQHGGYTSQSSASFSVPGVFDASYYNTPDIHSVLVHAVSSSSKEEGFQAIICFHPRPDLPAHLGLPTISNYEDKAFLQVANENQPFLQQHQVPKTNAMQVTVTEYLILLQFIMGEWPRLQSKLSSQLVTMREGTDPIYITGNLVFYNHGFSHFRVSLSSRLVFKAWIDSRDPKNNVKACLERHHGHDSPPAANGASGHHEPPSYHEMALPMNSLVALTQDIASYKALVDQMAAYKSRSRKRSKPVVP